MNFRFLSVLLLGLITLLASTVAVADLNMGIFPRRPAAVTHKLFKPLTEKLSKELGEPVKLVVAKDFKTFWKGVESKQYDIVHYNQYHYLLSHKAHGYKVIAVNEEFDSNQITGALLVRSDSGLNNVTDLKDKIILFGGGKKAMVSYIAVTAILKKAGLEADKDYTVKFARNPTGAVIGVYNKAADAAGSGNVILEIVEVKKKVDVSRMKTLAESDPFINLSWAVRDDMADDKASKIQAVMTGLKGSDDAVLKAAKVTNFVSASDGDFAKVRDIVKFVTGEDL